MGSLRWVWAELYVAHKLLQFMPQLGMTREVKSADIYLPKIKRRIQVKSSGSSFRDGALCAWSFRKKEMQKKGFDFAVLMRFDDKRPLKILNQFILSFSEAEKAGPRDDFKSGYGIAWFGEGNTDGVTNPVDLMLARNPADFANRWDKIK